MKKFFAFVLTIVYGASSFGITINMHYCCGKLDNVSIITKAADCQMQETMHGKGCCNNKAFEFKIKSDQETGSHQINLSSFQQAQIFAGNTFYKTFSKCPAIRHLYAATPPLFSSPPLFIQFSVFRV